MGNKLTIIWSVEDTELGKTRYHYTTNNEMTVEDFALKNEEYLKFGNPRYITKD